MLGRDRARRGHARRTPPPEPGHHGAAGRGAALPPRVLARAHRPAPPALVARVEGADGFAIHRVYLSPDGRGKAPVEPARMMLGATAGGAVRPLGSHRRLVVAEGIETALGLASSGLLDGPMSPWAALSASGMAALRLPPFVASADPVVASDGDRAGREAAHALAERATAEGWRVRRADPGDGLDFNDALRGRVAA